MVEVVIINWKRPHNVAKIVEALRHQTVSCIITICDCSVSEEFRLDVQTRSKVNKIFSSNYNLGGFNRYVPIGSFSETYTLFLDDDILPGKKCIETYLCAAQKCPDFGVLGQIGRTLLRDNIYRPIDTILGSEFVETDFVIRAYFVKTRYLYNILKFKWHIGYMETSLIEDDLLLCTSMQYYENLSCYLIPFNEDRETLVNKEELTNEHSLCSREDHYLIRSIFIKRALLYGWMPLHRRKSDD